MKFKRTNYCGLLREKDMEKIPVVSGWVQNKRDMGGIIFIDLRDREGTLQVVFDAKNLSKKDFEIADKLRTESVISVKGLIRVRDEETYNPKLITGTIEMAVREIEVLSVAQRLPFNVEEAEHVREDLRLKYRFLDLRRPRMFENLRFRAKVEKAARDFLDGDGFIPVETPILTKSTPEGARDYLVPSRSNKGKFYALPQSPQIFKQLLMVSGIDKYYQVARCFRDEDLRADRQPEFTQVDLELSFVDSDDMMELLEELFAAIMKGAKGIDIPRPIKRIPWQVAMDKYGSDKPDLRFDLPIIDLTEKMAGTEFSVFKSVLGSGGVVRAINAKGCGDFSRSTIDTLTDKAISYGAKGMAWIAMREDGTPYSILNKYFSEEHFEEILNEVGAEAGDFILFCADKVDAVWRTLGNLRIDVADLMGLRSKDDGKYEFAFITDFPQFEYSKEEGRYAPMHHPFTMPVEEDVEFLVSDPGRVRAQSYDVVLNGTELGSGSVRIHDPVIQKTMFETLGLSESEIDRRFGFMIDAFKYGTPPHAGFAFGLDRLVMILVGGDSLRDIIAFPKTKDGSCLLTDAPSVVDFEQLEVLGLDRPYDYIRDEEIDVDKSGKPAFTKMDLRNMLEISELALNDEEAKTFDKDMKDVIEFITNISDADVEDEEEMVYGLDVTNVFRKDEVGERIDRDVLLENTAEVREHSPFVPQVVE